MRISKLRISTAIIILLLTIFIIEQQHQLFAYIFANPNDNIFSHIVQIYQDKNMISVGVVDTPETYKILLTHINSNSNDTYILDNKKEYTSKGCDPGFGYKVDDENPICEPLGQTKEEKDNQTRSAYFCEALGCPFNPPSPYVD